MVKKSTRFKCAGGLRSPFSLAMFTLEVLADLRCALGDDLCGELTLTCLTEGPLACGRRAKKRLEQVPHEALTQWAALYQVVALSSHYRGPDVKGSRSSAEMRADARDTFIVQEGVNFETNQRLKAWRELPISARTDLVSQVVHMAQHEIWSVLGGGPPDDVLWHFRNGPGESFASLGQKSSGFKLSTALTVTPQAKQLLLRTMHDAYPSWARDLRDNGCRMHTVLGDRFSAVPKNADKLRTITVGPSLNVGFQLSVARALERSILRMGVTVRDQTRSHEPLLVWENGACPVATIDAKNSSNSITTELVRTLVPNGWFALLDTLRSHYWTDMSRSEVRSLCDGEYVAPRVRRSANGPSVTLDTFRTGVFYQYEMFSGMGNGFTFPLQSMIYAALARACVRVCGESIEMVRVYGDDVVIPRACAALMMEVMAFVGIETNRDKTFIFGAFREACGLDVVHGRNVKPVKVTGNLSSAPLVAGLHNRFAAHPYFRNFERALRYLHSIVEKPLYGPVDVRVWYDKEGDYCEHSDESRWFYSSTPPFEPVQQECCGFQAYWYSFDSWGPRVRPVGGWGDQKAGQPPEWARYRAFLGGAGEWDTEVLGTKVDKEQISSHWYVPDNWVLPPYGETRPICPSRRRVIEAVMGVPA